MFPFYGFASWLSNKIFQNFPKEIHPMKNSLIRVFVVALAIVGFSASSIATLHKTVKNAAASSNSRVNVASVPVCLPSDPTYCGLQ
jgi:hypothetical protein